MVDEGLLKRLREICGYFLEKDSFAGAVVRVEREGNLVAECAMGYALREEARQEPMSTDTLFDIASLTKLFTTTTILRFASLGLIDLDTPFSRQTWAEPFLVAAQSYPELCELYDRLTPAALLTHSSGLPAWHPFYAARELLREQPHEQLLWSAQSRIDNRTMLPTDFTPILHEILRVNPIQDRTIYSDINFMLLGMVAAHISGSGLNEALETRLTRPLQLNDTAYGPCQRNVAATEFGNRIEMQMTADRGLSFSGWRPSDRAIRGEADDGNCYYYFSGVAGHAGIFSSAKDLCELGKLYLPGRAAQGKEQEFIAPALVERASTETGAGRGLGFEFGPRYPHGFGHTGFTGTMLYISPKQMMTAALMTNRLHVRTPHPIDDFRKAVVEALVSL